VKRIRLLEHHPETTKVWITKYALTDGIMTADVVVSSEHVGVSVYLLRGRCYIGKSNWHRSEAAARIHVDKMIEAKRKSLMKQLANLDKLDPSTMRVKEME
jgi:hypothetical protein